jgi:hypothetical protein
MKQLPDELQHSENAKILQQEADEKVCNIVHLIYRARSYEGIAKDFEFSRRTMEEHWENGYNNARRTLAEPEVMRLPDPIEGVRIFDVCKDRSKALTVIKAASTAGTSHADQTGELAEPSERIELSRSHTVTEWARDETGS